MLADTDTSDPNYNPAPSQYANWAHAQYNYDADGQLATTTSGGTTTHAVTYSNSKIQGHNINIGKMGKVP